MAGAGGAALVAVEDTFLGADRDDPLALHRDTLDHAAARDVAGDRHAHRLVAPLRVRVARASRKIVGVDRDHERRGGAADRRKQTGGCRDVQRRRERIVLGREGV